MGLTVALVSLAYVYFGLYIWYVYGAYTALRAEPYSKYKCAALHVHAPHCPQLVPSLPFFLPNQASVPQSWVLFTVATGCACCGNS